MTAQATHTATSEYAWALLRMHELDPSGTVESPELDALCAETESLWPKMSGRERARVTGLSEDLYSLASGRAGVQMNDEERKRWDAELAAAREKRDWDAELLLLRKPFPSDLEGGFASIALRQGQCWMKLGEDAVASVFIAEAAKTLPEAADDLSLLYYLLGRFSDAMTTADKTLGRSDAGMRSLYSAAAALYCSSAALGEAAFQTTLPRLLDPMRRVISAERKVPVARRRHPALEARAARLLARCLLLTGRASEAITVCDKTIANYPSDAEMYLVRALIAFWGLGQVLEADLERAIDAGADDPAALVALVIRRLEQGKYSSIHPLTSKAFSLRRRIPKAIKAVMYEARGIASTELGQPPYWVEEEFSQALAIAPVADHERIRRNRDIAMSRLSRPDARTANRLTGLVPELRNRVRSETEPMRHFEPEYEETLTCAVRE